MGSRRTITRGLLRRVAAGIMVAAMAVGLWVPAIAAQDATQRPYTYAFWDTNSCYAQFLPEAPLGGTQFQYAGCDPETYHRQFSDGCYYHWHNGDWIPQTCQLDIIDFQGATFYAGYSNGAFLVRLHFSAGLGGAMSWFLLDTATGSWYMPTYGWTTVEHLVSVMLDEGFIYNAAPRKQQPSAGGSGQANDDDAVATIMQIWQDGQNAAIEPWLRPNCSASYNGC